MTDYLSLLARAVSGLSQKTLDMRRAVYARARTALEKQLRSVNPPLSVTEIRRERLALEAAINQLEDRLTAPYKMGLPPVESTREERLEQYIPRSLADPLTELARLIGQEDPFADFTGGARPHARTHLPSASTVANAWRKVNAKLTQEPHGARFELAGDGFFEFVPTGTQTDREVAAQPLTQQLQSEIQRKARELSERTIRLSNQVAWGGLAEATGLIAKLVNRPAAEVADNIGTVWSLSVSLGGYIEQTEDTIANPNSLVDVLEPDAVRVLRDFVTTVGPWVRRFPTGRILDDEAREFASGRNDAESAATFFRRTEQAALIRTDDAKVVEVALDVGNRDAALANKARGWSILSVRNIGIAMLGVLTLASGGYVNEIGAGIAKRSEIANRIEKVVLDGEKELLALFSGLPADIRAAMRTVFDAMRRTKQQLPPKDTP